MTLWGVAANKTPTAVDHSTERRLSEVAKAFHIPLSEYTTRELLHEIVKSSDFVGRGEGGANVFVLALSNKAMRAFEMFDPLNDPDLENPASEDQPAGFGNYLQDNPDFEPAGEREVDDDVVICEAEETFCDCGPTNAINYEGTDIQRPTTQLHCEFGN